MEERNLKDILVVDEVSKKAVRLSVNIVAGRGLSLRLLFLVILALLGVGATVGTTIAYYPNRPKYCARCHSMRPAYDRWARSVCGDVSCAECHTGGKGVICLSLEIEDSNCGKCHTREKLFAKKEPYKNTLPFSHETHLKEDPPGLRMRCTACHSYQGGEKHFDIDEKTCSLCHFAPRREGTRFVDGGGQGLGSCTLCHKDVEKKVQIYDKEFDHATFEKLVLGSPPEVDGGSTGVGCMDCHHNETVHGLGSVEKRQCYYCHDRVPEGYSSAKEMHYDHTVRHKVSCNPCHQVIDHKIYKEDKELESCESCKDLLLSGFGYAPHSVRAENASASCSITGLVQRQMMKGEGGLGVGASPDPMFLATVSCTACHRLSADGRGYDKQVKSDVCNSCHEKGFEKIYKEQRDAVTSQMEVLKELLEAVQRAGRAEGVETMEARHNYEFIASDGSLGVHNIKYTKELLEVSIRQLREALGG